MTCCSTALRAHTTSRATTIAPRHRVAGDCRWNEGVREVKRSKRVTRPTVAPSWMSVTASSVGERWKRAVAGVRAEVAVDRRRTAAEQQQPTESSTRKTAKANASVKLDLVYGDGVKQYEVSTSLQLSAFCLLLSCHLIHSARLCTRRILLLLLCVSTVTRRACDQPHPMRSTQHCRRRTGPRAHSDMRR